VEPKVILQVEDLSKNFGGFQAVSEISFGLTSGEILGLVGPNGAGKTTLFHLISGFLKPTKGHIIYQGRDITRLPPHRRAKLGVVRTFQQAKVFAKLSVSENIRTSFHLRGRSAADDDNPVERMLEFTELEAVAEQNAGDLAYGDQRTLGIAIALGARPKVLLLDEPFAGMNPVEATRCMSLIHRIRQAGTSVLLVDHHMDTLVKHCDRLVVVHHGEKLVEGDPQTVTQNAEVIECYLGGDDFTLETIAQEGGDA